VLPIRQTSNQTRPAGINLPIAPSVPAVDAFHPPTPASIPMVPLAIPAPPVAPPELAAPVTASLDPAAWGLESQSGAQTGRRRGEPQTDPAQRAMRQAKSAPTTSLPARLLGRGKSGAARMLVLALVVGAEGVAVTTMSGHAQSAPADPSTAGINNAFEYSAARSGADKPVSAALAGAATQVKSGATGASPTIAPTPDLQALQQESSGAKVTAALAQANAAAARVKAAQQRRDRAMRNAQSDPKSVAKVMMIDRGWGSAQFSCLDKLWTRESGWNYRATNPSSGAYGIPQALHGSDMASAGSDWRTNPVTQIKWGLDYISDRYGTPCGAWAHSQSTGWY
jgi:hypothetical protein